MKFLCFLLFFSAAAFSQNQFTVAVLDASEKTGVPYAVAGMTSRKYTVMSDDKGILILNTPGLLDSDTLKIIALGYKDKIVTVKEMKSFNGRVYLFSNVTQLSQVNIKAGKLQRKIYGSKSFHKSNCTAFIGSENNWKGEEAAIRADYKGPDVALIEDFSFYIIKNNYDDSLVFRLMLYKVNDYGFPGRTFLSKPIIFKTKVKNGVVSLDLKDRRIYADSDFFISLECLMDKMEAEKFCFAGSIDVPSFVRTSAFSKWSRVKGGGADFSVTLSYQK